MRRDLTEIAATWCWRYTAAAVALFAVVWSPQVFYLSGRHRFHYSVEPRCALEIPSELSDPLGFLIGPGVHDIPTLTQKPLLANLSAAECHGLKVLRAAWSSSRNECRVQVQVQSGAQAAAREFEVPLVRSAEYGVASAEGCGVLQHPRTRSRWLFEDVCVRNDHAVVVDNWRECIGEFDEFRRGRHAYAGLGVTGEASFSAWVHVVCGNVYFMVGVIQFRAPGLGGRRWHKTLGRVYAALNVLTYFATVTVTLYTAPSLARVILNVVLVNNYWVFSLVAAVRAIRRGDVISHRAWMLRNFSVAFAIVTGRYWGTILLLVFWPFYGGGTDAGDSHIILSVAAHALLVELFLKSEAARRHGRPSDGETKLH
mmetsp:Transcript_87512/g.245760  ORF Transcript_87512/g.245760 Transcript_87512/m.245760 type:complete len:370 (-) Transcript_87512:60-1169(-)